MGLFDSKLIEILDDRETAHFLFSQHRAPSIGHPFGSPWEASDTVYHLAYGSKCTLWVGKKQSAGMIEGDECKIRKAQAETDWNG